MFKFLKDLNFYRKGKFLLTVVRGLIELNFGQELACGLNPGQFFQWYLSIIPAEVKIFNFS